VAFSRLDDGKRSERHTVEKPMRILKPLLVYALATLLVAIGGLTSIAAAQSLPAPVLREAIPLPDGAPLPEPDPDPTPGTRTIRFTEDTNDVLNPERGIFRTGVAAYDGNVQNFSRHRTEFGSTIAYDRIMLDAYRNVDTLPSTLISKIRANLGAVRNSGVKAVIRIHYGSAEASDPVKSRLLNHIAQFKATFNDYQDVIAWVEAGFVGRWGEWHGSSTTLHHETEPGKTNVRDFANAIFAAVPSSRMVAFRYPKYMRAISSGATVSASQAYNGTNLARLAHHNDCFLWGPTDRGTYISSQTSTEKSYLGAQTNYTFTTGETCGIDSAYDSRSNCSVALVEAAEFHWVAMNDRVYATTEEKAVVEKWKAQGCWDQIKKRLGYRFVLVDAKLPDTTVAPGKGFNLTFRVRNDGFARLVNARTAYVTLTSGSTRRDIALNSNPRFWAPGVTTTVSETVTVPSNLPAGTYTVSLWLPDQASTLRDNSMYAVRFANSNTWVSTTGLNSLGTISVGS
jgi:hypothetical protein